MIVPEICQIIATRQLSLDQQELTIQIGIPFMPVDYDENYCCPYRIRGLGNEKLRYASGVDSVQALYLTLMKIGTDLYTSQEGKAGRILWNGSGDLGFPLPETIKDLIPK